MSTRTRSSTVRGVLGETRGRILGELCGQPQSAIELAEHLRISSNAIRVHLEGLRDAGLVDYTVARRGVGKPTHVFALTATAERLLSAAYAPTLQALVDTLRTRLNGGFEPMLRATGVALLQRLRAQGGASKKASVDCAVEMLGSLGAPASIERRGRERVLSNRCCPLSAITRETPEACRMMESLLSSASGRQVRESCERGEHPRCSFIIGSPVRD
jgi:predicted ArsR family transcriptional regulator